MYRTIMVPVDLEHIEDLDKALKTAGDLAGQYNATVVYVGVTSSSPGASAHNPEEYQRHLDDLAAKQGQAHGRPASAKAFTTPDPSHDLDKILEEAVGEVGADLVVMATHVPHFRDALFSSNAGHMASHANVSVFVVR